MSTTDNTNAARQGSGSNDLLGLVERLRFLASGQDDAHSEALTDAADKLARCGGDNCMGRRCDDVTNWVTEQAAQARVAAERERCAKLADSMCMGQPGHTAPHPIFLYRRNVGEVIRAGDTAP